jgi:hypothetical protein
LDSLFYFNLFYTGKRIVDGVNGTDKNLLIRYSAQELQEAMDSIKKDEKRFAAHSVDEKGKELTIAEECARLLQIGQEDGVKSQGKSKKREDARGIEHREWLVWLPEDKVPELKYSTINFDKDARKAGGSSNFRYHVYCCSELGTGRVALRRIAVLVLRAIILFVCLGSYVSHLKTNRGSKL